MPNLSKQIAYPSFSIRLFTITLDLLIVRLVFQPFFNYLNKDLFKRFFDEYLIAFDKPLNNLETLESFFKTIPGEIYFSYIFVSVVIQFSVMGIYFIVLWHKFGITPAKFLLKMKIVDYDTMQYLSLEQSIKRYIACLLLPISLIKVIFDKKNRTLHDVYSNSIVVKN